tara:strand:- start:1041 stop:1559 length:519 start_codon:yes stop_codon:yes gene_type:complete
MREWRKIYRGISVSDKIAKLSMDARWLFILLVVFQDDRGAYPWSRSKMKSLVAGSTEWTTNDVQRLSAELESAKLIETQPSYLKIIDGSKKNGNLYKWRDPLLYDIPELELDSNTNPTESQQSHNKLKQVTPNNQNLKLKTYKDIKGVKKNGKVKSESTQENKGRFKDSEIS